MKMIFKARPEDFVVREILRIEPQPSGSYSLYRLTKRGISTLQAHARLASALGVRPSAIAFPGLKDKKAVASQFFSLKGKGPEEVKGPGFSAKLVGFFHRPLRPEDIQANEFTLTLRLIPPDAVPALEEALGGIREDGLPNYFDRQRFASMGTGGEFPGKKILQRDAEGALRLYLTAPSPLDPPSCRAFKEKARELWGRWDELLKEAPSPSNFRSVLTYLKDHPAGFRKALNLVTPRVLTLFLSSYQSWLWNRLAGRFIREKLNGNGVPFSELEIAGETLPFPLRLPEGLREELAELVLPFFHHRAVFEGPELSRLAREILEEEGLELRDFKARILEKAYLSRGGRRLLLFPQILDWSFGEDELNPGAIKMGLRLLLPPGSYATLVVKAVALRAISSKSGHE